MIKTSAPACWILLLFVLLAAPQVVYGGDDLSDDQKKEIVYRMYQEYKNKDFPLIKNISPGEALALLRAHKVIFVDTRKSDEMRVSTLPGAIAKKEFLEDTDAFTEKTIVTYCTISYRSGRFAREMASRGITVFNLEGGILAWTLEGGKVYDADGETRRIHVYGKEWDYAPAGYETVTFGFFKRLF